MKRIILLIITLLPLTAMAQTDLVAPLMEKYSSLKNCSTVTLSSEMLRSVGANSGIETMHAIAVEDPAYIEEFRADIKKITPGYNLIMSVNSDGTNVQIYRVTQVYKPQGSIKRKEMEDILIIGIEETEGILVRLTGNNIELSEATSLIDM